MNLDPAKIMVVLVVALIVLGPERLPTVIRQVGGYWTEFKKVRDRVREEVNGALGGLGDIAAVVTEPMNSLRQALVSPLVSPDESGAAPSTQSFVVGQDIEQPGASTDGSVMKRYIGAYSRTSFPWWERVGDSAFEDGSPTLN